jgi:ribonuclease Z
MNRIAIFISMLAVAQSALAQEESDAWYPRTEKVPADEMFVVALGTGMPTPITRAQKSSAWYVELGNGDIFLFDAGSGSSENLFALRPDFERVDKIFASHLHSDHVGDTDAIFIGGNRGWALRPSWRGSKTHTPGILPVAPGPCPTPVAN